MGTLGELMPDEGGHQYTGALQMHLHIFTTDTYTDTTGKDH